jgi:hypothetical protein
MRWSTHVLSYLIYITCTWVALVSSNGDIGDGAGVAQVCAGDLKVLQTDVSRVE